MWYSGASFSVQSSFAWCYRSFEGESFIYLLERVQRLFGGISSFSHNPVTSTLRPALGTTSQAGTDHTTTLTGQERI